MRGLRGAGIWSAIAIVAGCAACPPPPSPVRTVDPETLPRDPLELLERAERWSRDGTTLTDKLNALLALDRAARFGADPFVTEVLRARDCFSLADENRDHADRDAWIDAGIAAAEAAAGVRPDRAEGHYYLGVLVGLRAEAAPIGALDDVPLIKREAQAAIDLDHTIDDCGPLRLMGMLLIAAPPWPQSIGDAEAGVDYLREAVECSDYPLNSLLLAEGLLEIGERQEARELLEWVLSRPPTGRWGATGNRYRPLARELLERARTPPRPP